MYRSGIMVMYRRGTIVTMTIIMYLVGVDVLVIGGPGAQWHNGSTIDL